MKPNLRGEINTVGGWTAIYLYSNEVHDAHILPDRETPRSEHHIYFINLPWASGTPGQSFRPDGKSRRPGLLSLSRR